MVVIQVDIPDGLLERMMRIVKEGKGYAHKSEFVRSALTEKCDREEEKND